MTDLMQRMALATVERGATIWAMKEGASIPLVVLEGYEGEQFGPTTFTDRWVESDTPETVHVNVSGVFGWRPGESFYTRAVIDTENLTQLVGVLGKAENVEGVVFHVDSPGGDARGIRELSRAVQQLAALKPTTVINEGEMCSAAYYGFCGATEVLNDNVNTITGSIGCYSMLSTMHRMFESYGIDFELVSSGGVKGEGSPFLPISPDYVAQHQTMVDGIAEEFRGAVRSTRDLSAENERTAFNGFYWMHDRAQSLGLVDGLANQGDNEMSKDVQTSLAALVEAMEAQVKQSAAILEAVSKKPAEPAAAEPEPLDPEEEAEITDIESHLDRAAKEGKLTAANATELTETLASLPKSARSAIVDTLPVVVKQGVKSAPPAGESNSATVRTPRDRMAALLNSNALNNMGIVLTGESIEKYAGANSFSPAHHTLCAVPSHLRGKVHEIRDEYGDITNLVERSTPKKTTRV